MNLNDIFLAASGGVALEPMIEHLVMSRIPASMNSLKPAIAWLIATAYAIGMVAVQGGDWRQAIGNTIGTLVTMELKHQSPWGAEAQPAPAPEKK